MSEVDLFVVWRRMTEKVDITRVKWWIALSGNSDVKARNLNANFNFILFDYRVFSQTEWTNIKLCNRCAPEAGLWDEVTYQCCMEGKPVPRQIFLNYAWWTVGKAFWSQPWSFLSFQLDSYQRSSALHQNPVVALSSSNHIWYRQANDFLVRCDLRWTVHPVMEFPREIPLTNS